MLRAAAAGVGLLVDTTACPCVLVADRQDMDISVTVYLFVCTVTDFSAHDKASGVKFCTAVHRRPRQGISHFGNFAPPEAENRTNRPACTEL